MRKKSLLQFIALDKDMTSVHVFFFICQCHHVQRALYRHSIKNSLRSILGPMPENIKEEIEQKG